MNFVHLAVTVFLSLFLSSCNNDCCISDDYNVKSDRIFGAVQPPEICTNLTKKEFVYDLLHDSYLWADTTPFADFSDEIKYPDEYKLLEDLKNQKDRFSFIMPKKEYEDFFVAAKSIGFGFSFVWRGSQEFIDSLQINLVYPGSFADKAGLKRSDIVLSIDGNDIDKIYHDSELLKRYFGFTDELNATFTIKLPSGATKDINITKAEFDVKSVIKSEVLEVDQKKVGYLLFQSFTGSSKSELEEAFSRFKEENIQDLILDLRYNGGGYVYIANLLSSLIAGEKIEGKIFMKRVFNEKYSVYDQTDYFLGNQPFSLSLSRVFIITTQSSCSASELVIKSLKASKSGVKVIQIGDRTCGKPYGMIGGEYCNQYILPVQMKNLNADGNGEYIDGLLPDCKASDDIWHDFADFNESSFKSAVFYISNNRCDDLEKSERGLKNRLQGDEESFKRRFNVF